MEKDWIEIIFLLDQSGSMAGLEQDTIGGFNSMLEKLKLEKGKALVSTVLFNGRTEILHDRLDIRNVPELTAHDYMAAGSTALLDAVGGAIHHIGLLHRKEKETRCFSRTIFVITTDGMENSSRRYTLPEVKQMIEREKKQYEWEFLFLGANIDAVKTAGRFGIGKDRAVNYHNDSIGVRLNYEVVGEAVGTLRSGRKLSAHWKDRIDEDYRTR